MTVILILGAVVLLVTVLTIRQSRKEVRELEKENEERNLKNYNDYCLSRGSVDYFYKDNKEYDSNLMNYSSDSSLPKPIRSIPMSENVKPVRGQRAKMNVYDDCAFDLNQEELNTTYGAYVYTKDGEKVWKDDVKVIKISADDCPNELLPEYMGYFEYKTPNSGLVDLAVNSNEDLDSSSYKYTQNDMDSILEDNVMSYEDEIPSYIIHEERSREPFITDEEAPEYMRYFESKTTFCEPINFNGNSNEDDTTDTTRSEDSTWE